MTTALKYMYNPLFFERLCPTLSEHIPGFDGRNFVFRIFNNQWPDLGLKERVRHISLVLHHFLSKDFSVACQQLIVISQTLRSRHHREQGFEYIFLTDYIEVFGLDQPQLSLPALEEITKLVSAEYCYPPLHPSLPKNDDSASLQIVPTSGSERAKAFQRRVPPPPALGNGPSGL